MWGDFDSQLSRFRDLLAACPPELAMMDGLREAVVAFNQFDPTDVPWHRRRMELILRVPALQADSTLRYASWRSVVAAFVADRTGRPQDALLPRQVGYAALATCIAAYEQWLADEGTDLAELLNAAMRELQGASAAMSRSPVARRLHKRQDRERERARCPEYRTPSRRPSR